MEYIKLNDCVEIPAIGFGTFLIPPDGTTYRSVREALEVGYRHIDTATAYENEEEVGRAVRDSGIPREEVFITSKLWLSQYGEPQKGVERSLKKLNMDYIDLYLIHQPYFDVLNAWKGLEEAKAAGKLRSIGVSNLSPKIWNEFIPKIETFPSVNQIECNPFAQQKAIRAMMTDNDVKVECWGPLGQGNKDLLTNETLRLIGERYGKNIGQVILRFETQDGMIVLPKSVHPERIKSNLDIFDFTLTEDEMNVIRALDTDKPTRDPDAPGRGEYLNKKFQIVD